MKQNVKRVLTAAPVVLLLSGCDEAIVNAGYNTLLGMGMAFFVLIIISLVISLLSVINKSQETKKQDDKALRQKAVDNAVKQIEKQEQASTAQPVPPQGSASQDGGFMLAIFAAAIAAYEADNGTGTSPVITGVTPVSQGAQPLPDLSGWDGVYVRPVRRQNTGNWKRA